MSNNPLKDIAFEDINDEYCYGQYADFKVIMMKKNGYINATKMCKYISDEINVKKQFVDWNRTQQAKELMDASSNATGYPVASLTITIGTSDPKIAVIRGTYANPKLIPHIASWASPKFAVRISDIVTEYFNKKELEKHERLLKKKDDKIDELKAMMKEQSEEIKKQTEKIDNLLHKNKKISRKLSHVRDQNSELIDKIDNISENRVVDPPNEMDKQEFIIMRDDSDDAERTKKYYAIRTKSRSAKSAIKKYQLEHEDSTILINIKYNPNSINLWDRVKAKLDKKIRIRINNFGLRKGYTEEQLIDDINELNDEKYDY